MELDKIRENIDQVDTELTLLLEKRLALVSQVAQYKKAQQMSVLDQKRENDLLEKVAARVVNPEFTDCVVDTYKGILKNSRDFQTKMLE
jgi:chorismate mutase